MSSASRFRCLLMCAIFVMAGVLTPAPAVADLPSSVASRVTKINRALDAVESAIELDRMTTAERRLKEANRYLKEIKDRYAGKFDEADPDYAAMIDRLEAVTARVEGAEAEAAAAEAAGKEAEAANEALCEEWIEKLSPFIDYKSESYLRIAAEFNRASPEEQAQSKAAYPRAKALFTEYQAVEFPLGKSMELKNVESRLVGALKYYGMEEADAAQEEACKVWVDRLAPYVDVGMNSPKHLVPSATVNSRQLAEQQRLFEEAKLLFAEYQQAEFPLGKTARLESLEEAMARALEAFPAAIAESHAMMSGDVGTRLDGVLAYLNRDTEWKKDETKKPPIVMERDLEPLREGVAQFAETASDDDAKLVALRAKLAEIERIDAEHREIRAERTFQRPDRYAGSDLKTLKKKAESIAKDAYPKCKIAKVTVPSEDWAIEDVVEYTDTTNTAVRRRITRSVRAEVSLRDSDGAVWLQEIYLAQDRLPNGDWGSLKGHTTWVDPMAAQNLGKLAPMPGN